MPYYLQLTALILSILSLATGIAVLWNLRSLNKLRKNFTVAGESLNLESIINLLDNKLARLEKEESHLENNLAELKKEFGFAVQKIGMVRFNPFGDSGGNFSFSLALLDGHNTGLVITSMHGREQNRIYTKRVEQGKSEIKLTGEEQKAIETANQR